MKAPGLRKLRQAAGRLRRRFTNRALILLYHRVAEIPSDPWMLCVTPQHFAEHLEVLAKSSRSMPLQKLLQALKDKNLPRRSVIITFDDGYADNLQSVKPLLERYDVPATIFVATGRIGYDREFWWDELDRLLLQPSTLPETLCLRIDGTTHQWQLGEAAHYSQKECQRHRSWSVREKHDPSPRHSIYRALYYLLQPLPDSSRQKALEDLLAWANAGPTGRATHLFLTSEEVVALGRGGLVEVGSHTVNHPKLSTLPAALQREEIQRSKARLEEILNHLVTSFAYPYGDYSEETVAIVREAGFTSACTTLPGTVERQANRFRLPRVHIRDWDGEEFARRVSNWFHE